MATSEYKNAGLPFRGRRSQQNCLNLIFHNSCTIVLNSFSRRWVIQKMLNNLENNNISSVQDTSEQDGWYLFWNRYHPILIQSWDFEEEFRIFYRFSLQSRDLKSLNPSKPGLFRDLSVSKTRVRIAPVWSMRYKWKTAYESFLLIADRSAEARSLHAHFENFNYM